MRNTVNFIFQLTSLTSVEFVPERNNATVKSVKMSLKAPQTLNKRKGLIQRSNHTDVKSIEKV